MIKVCVEVRDGAALFDVAVYADSISEAVGIAEERFSGRNVRVVFPIDGEEFFAGREAEGDGAEDTSRPRLLPDRVG